MGAPLPCQRHLISQAPGGAEPAGADPRQDPVCGPVLCSPTRTGSCGRRVRETDGQPLAPSPTGAAPFTHSSVFVHPSPSHLGPSAGVMDEPEPSCGAVWTPCSSLWLTSIRLFSSPAPWQPSRSDLLPVIIVRITLSCLTLTSRAPGPSGATVCKVTSH